MSKNNELLMKYYKRSFGDSDNMLTYPGVFSVNFADVNGYLAPETEEIEVKANTSIMGYYIPMPDFYLRFSKSYQFIHSEQIQTDKNGNLTPTEGTYIDDPVNAISFKKGSLNKHAGLHFYHNDNNSNNYTSYISSPPPYLNTVITDTKKITLFFIVKAKYDLNNYSGQFDLFFSRDDDWKYPILDFEFIDGIYMGNLSNSVFCPNNKLESKYIFYPDEKVHLYTFELSVNQFGVKVRKDGKEMKMSSYVENNVSDEQTSLKFTNIQLNSTAGETPPDHFEYQASNTGYWTEAGEWFPIGNPSKTINIGRKSLSGAQNAWILLEDFYSNISMDVLSTYFRFGQQTSNGTKDTCKVRIYIEDIGNASNPTSIQDAESKNLIGGISWIISSVSANTTFTTPDLTSLVKHVTSRSDWREGNAIAFYILDDGSTIDAFRTFLSEAWYYSVNLVVSRGPQPYVTQAYTDVGALYLYSRELAPADKMNIENTLMKQYDIVPENIEYYCPSIKTDYVWDAMNHKKDPILIEEMQDSNFNNGAYTPPVYNGYWRNQQNGSYSFDYQGATLDYNSINMPCLKFLEGSLSIFYSWGTNHPFKIIAQYITMFFVCQKESEEASLDFNIMQGPALATYDWTLNCKLFGESYIANRDIDSSFKTFTFQQEAFNTNVNLYTIQIRTFDGSMSLRRNGIVVPLDLNGSYVPDDYTADPNAIFELSQFYMNIQYLNFSALYMYTSILSNEQIETLENEFMERWQIS